MSSRPSSFGALMTNARRLAAKKNPSSSSSTKKANTLALHCRRRKALDCTEVKTDQENASNGLAKPIKDPPKPNLDETQKPPDSSAELKGKFGLVKTKPTDFDPKMLACWEKGEKVPFLFLRLAFDLISNETGRIVISDIVCNMFRTVIDTTPDDLVATVYLAAHKVAPAHEGLELGIGDASVIKALAEACGRTESQVKSQYEDKGDLGLVAQASRSSQWVIRKPDPLTVVKGFDAFGLIAKMKLRIGFSEQTLMAAGGHAAVYNEKHSKSPPNIQASLEEDAKIVKQVFSVLPVYHKVLPVVLIGDIWNLPKTCSVMPGVPVGTMLAKATKGFAEIVNKFQAIDFVCEYNYDGESAQIHYLENGSVEIYSRNAERNTGKFPEVVATISRGLMTHLKKKLGFYSLLTALISNDLEKIQAFLNSAVSPSCEGLIIKTLDRDATYEPSKKSLNWLKLNDYLESIGDTLDVVSIATFHGRGKWTTMKNTKTATGFTESELEECSASLRSKVIPEPKGWEVEAAYLTISPVHRAAVMIVYPDKVAEIYNAQNHNQTNNEDDCKDG